MTLLAYALLLAVALFVVRRRIGEDPDDTSIVTPLGLLRELVAPLLLGLVTFGVTVRGLLRGEVACYSKGGGCAASSFARAVNPEQYWVNLGFFVLVSIVALLFAWAAYRRWLRVRGN